MAEGNEPRPVDEYLTLFSYNPNGCTDLNSPTNTGNKLFILQPYVWNASNNPTTGGGGILMTMYYSNAYTAGTQLAFGIDIQGAYYRRLRNGEWQAWVSLI